MKKTFRAWQDTLRLATYPLGADDPNPPLQRQGASWAIYPYPLRDDVQEGPPVERDYTAVHIENEFLHAIVLPELGGHLHSLFDKVTGQEVFYRNRVVKYGLVATRGAWISGGIEFNFPMGHTYTTVDPVSWEMGDDGDEAWLAVGNICRLSRMEWWVRLSLAAGERRLHERVTLHNRRPYKQRHWFWNNTAVPAADDLRLVYPARKARVGGRVVDYPLADGRDISRYPAHDHADDIFTLGVKEDFFGCHYGKRDFGMVNVASHRDVHGRKYFTWGTADDGMIWTDLLTDTDGQYVEIQSGRFETQSIWEFLPPYETAIWDEYWLPEHGLGGWVWANDLAVLNFEVGDGRLRLGVLPAVVVKGATLYLEAHDQIVWSQTIAAGPQRPFTIEIPIPRGCTADTAYVLALGDPSDDYGEEIIRYEHPPRYTLQPKVAETGENVPAPVKAEDACTAEELCVRAADAWKHLELPAARRLFEKALASDAGFATAHTGLGQLDLAAGLYEPAGRHFEQAVARNPDAADAWYYLGLTRHWQGNPEAALDALWAARRLDANGPAYSLICEVEDTVDGEADEPFADDEVPAFITDRDYGLHPYADASPVPAGRAATDPVEGLAHWARGDAHNWLETAFSCPSAAEAARTLELAVECCPAANAYPMTHYCLGHWYAQVDRLRDSVEEYRRALACAPDYCFPSRHEELPILEAAVKRNGRDWKARLYLGNLLAAWGRGPEAMAQWRAAVAVHDGYAVLHRNLGFGALQWESDPGQAAGHYRRALAANPADYRYYLDLANLVRRQPSAAAAAGYAGALGDGANATAVAELAIVESAPPEVLAKWQVAARVAELLLHLRRYDDSLAVLRRHRFFPWEGARHMREVYASCLVAKGDAAAAAGDHTAARADYEASMEYPRNLGVGKVARPQDARLYWLAAREAQALGDEQGRQRHLTAAATEPHPGPCEADVWKVLALRELGRSAEAGRLESEFRAWAAGLTDEARRSALLATLT